jgi:ATP-binding cassette, subfamily C, bacterial CydCD
VRALDPRLVRRARPVRVLLGVDVAAVAVSAHAAGSLDRVLIAMLALLALASFEALQSGPSGSRKTTIVNLLVRFLDPEDGRVTLGGRDPREYRQEDVRRAIAVAGQDSHLFSTTIRENVRLARPDASDAEIEDALRRARILEGLDRMDEIMRLRG